MPDVMQEQRVAVRGDVLEPWWRRSCRRRRTAFSTTIVCLSGLAIDCAIRRATVSVGPPAANGTSSVMGLLG